MEGTKISLLCAGAIYSLTREWDDQGRVTAHLRAEVEHGGGTLFDLTFRVAQDDRPELEEGTSMSKVADLLDPGRMEGIARELAGALPARAKKIREVAERRRVAFTLGDTAPVEHEYVVGGVHYSVIVRSTTIGFNVQVYSATTIIATLMGFIEIPTAAGDRDFFYVSFNGAAEIDW